MWFRAEISGPFQTLPRTFIVSTIRRSPDGKMLHGHDSWIGVDASVADAQLRRAQTEGPPKRVTVEKLENSLDFNSCNPQPLHRTNSMGKGVQFRTEPGNGRRLERFLRDVKNHGKSLLKSKGPKRTSGGRPAFPKSRTSSVRANLS